MAEEKSPLKWKFKTGDNVRSSPAVVDGVVYFGSEDGHLYAVDIKTGDEKWKFETPERVYSSPAVVDGVVYFGSNDNYLYAVDIKTGEEKWKFETGDGVFSSPAVVDGVVYFGSEDNNLYALDAKTGQKQWRFSARWSGAIYSSPAVVNGVVYFGSEDGHLYAVDIKTGEEKWKFKTGDSVYSSPAVVDGVVYFGFYQDSYSDDNHLYAVDSKTGEEKWKFKTGDSVYSSSANLYQVRLQPVVDGVVYFGSSDNHLYAVDAKTGEEQWKFKTGDNVRSSPAVVDGVVYFGSCDNYLYAVDTKTGEEKWKFKTGDSVSSSPAVVDGVVYFGSWDSLLYAVDIKLAGKLKPDRKREEREQMIEKQKAEEETPTEENILHNIDCKVTLETYSTSTIVEKAAGTVDISEIVNAISSGESIEDKWHDYNDIRHVYGTTDIADTVNFSDSEIQDKWDEDGYLDISADADADDFDIDNLEKGDYKYLLSSPTFILTAESYEKGKWNTYSIDIKGEFDPELIKPYCSGELICGYEYDGMEMDSNQDMESTTSHTDISIYLITKDGIELADFDEIRSNMTEKGLDSENEDDIRKYLKDEYGVE